MADKLRNKRFLISILFASFMTLLFLTLSIGLGLGLGVFNSRNIIKSIDQSDYFNKAYHDINEKTESILLEAGLPSGLLSDIINPGRVHADGMNYVEASLGNKSWHSPDIQQEIIRNIKGYIQDDESAQPAQPAQSAQSAQPDQDDKPAQPAHILASTIEYEYKDIVEISFVDHLMSYRAKYSRTMIIVIPLIIISIAVLSYMLVRMYRHRYRGIRYVAYAMIASSVLTVTIAFYLLSIRGTIDPEVGSDYYQQFISGYVKMGITVYIYIGLIGFMVAMALISLIKLMRKQVVYKDRMVI